MEKQSSQSANNFRFLLGAMVGVVMALIFTWIFSGKLMEEGNPVSDSSKATTEVIEPEEPKKELNIKPTIEIKKAYVSAKKMQVFYIGVDNPIEVSIPGVEFKDIALKCSGCEIRGGYSQKNVNVRKPGEVILSVFVNEEKISDHEFRAKRIPDPVVRLSKSQGGAMGVGEFKAQGGLGAYLDNFDFDAKCQVQGFQLTYVPRKEDKEVSVNAGARYTTDSKKLINVAKPGDTYYFNNVKVKCPGDPAGRKVNSLVFQIK